MTDCQIRGCRNLKKVCEDCGRSVCTYEFKEWPWIKCTDTLPEIRCPVLVLLKDQKTFSTGCLQNKIGSDEKEWEIDAYTDYYYFRIEEVLYWMPLPKPPEES